MRNQIIAITIIFVLIGCGSKKKVVDKSREENKSTVVVNSKSEGTVSLEDSLISRVKRSKDSTKELEDFSGEIADTSKVATVTIEESNGTKTYSYTNFKNVRSSSGYSKILELDSIDRKQINKSDWSITWSIDSIADQSSRKKSTNKDLNVERGFPWHWIIIVLALYLIGSYIRGNMNPLKWFV